MAQTPPSKTRTPRRKRTSYSEDVAKRVCEAIAQSSCGVKKMVTADLSLPSEASIYQWLHDYPEFRRAYELARERQAEMLVLECLEIADDSREDVRPRLRSDANFDYIDSPVSVARCKLRIETRLRVAAMLAPKKYGQVVEVVVEKIVEVPQCHRVDDRVG